MTPPLAHALATAVVVLHVAFVLFVVFGSIWVLRRPKAAYAHLAAVAWAVYVEWSGAICPLTGAYAVLIRRGSTTVGS